MIFLFIFLLTIVNKFSICKLFSGLFVLYLLTEETTETRSMTERSGRTDTSGRSAALERAYVHDVYENCEEPNGQIRPKVAQFLGGLEPGSLVCDVGCGNGRYLSGFNPLIYTIGVDRCYRLTQVAHGKGGEVSALNATFF